MELLLLGSEATVRAASKRDTKEGKSEVDHSPRTNGVVSNRRRSVAVPCQKGEMKISCRGDEPFARGRRKSLSRAALSRAASLPWRSDSRRSGIWVGVHFHGFDPAFRGQATASSLAFCSLLHVCIPKVEPDFWKVQGATRVYR